MFVIIRVFVTWGLHLSRQVSHYSSTGLADPCCAVLSRCCLATFCMRLSGC